MTDGFKDPPGPRDRLPNDFRLPDGPKRRGTPEKELSLGVLDTKINIIPAVTIGILVAWIAFLAGRATAPSPSHSSTDAYISDGGINED